MMSMELEQNMDALNKEFVLLAEAWNKIDESISPKPDCGICVLCKNHLNNKYGNHPHPVRKKGKCCDRCNNDRVIPARLGAEENPIGDFDEQIMCRKLLLFCSHTTKYPNIQVEFYRNNLDNFVADLIEKFYRKVISRGCFPTIRVDEGISVSNDLFRRIQDNNAVIKGIKPK